MAIEKEERRREKKTEQEELRRVEDFARIQQKMEEEALSKEPVEWERCQERE